MKKRASRFVALPLALVCLVMTMCIGASATEISPRYVGIYQLHANLNISSSGRANCYGYVAIQDDYSVDLTVELQRDGRTIKSWSDSGSDTISISEPYYVTPDHDYQVVVSADVYNSQGRLVDTPSTESIVISY